MSKCKLNKNNAVVNHEYAQHVRAWRKKHTQRKKRAAIRRFIKIAIQELHP